MVTLLAKRERNVASSIAESPPPTTAISWSRKKNPSQVAQVESPCPTNSYSLGSSNMTERAPVETMTASAEYDGSSLFESPIQIRNGEVEKSTRDTFCVKKVAPKRSA